MRKLKRFRVRLVRNWRQGWKWASLQSDFLTGVAASAWLAVPGDMRAAVPPGYLAIAALALAVFGFIGRLVERDDDD